MDHQLKSMYNKYALLLVLVVVLTMASCDFLCIEGRQIVKSSTKYQHVNFFELGADEHNSGEGMKKGFRSHMKIIYEDQKFGTTSSGNSPGVGHSYGQHNEGNNAEPKEHLLGSSASSSSGATNFVTGFNFKGDIPPPLSAGVGHAIPHRIVKPKA